MIPNYDRDLAALGPWKDHTPEQVARMRALVADQADGPDLLAILGIKDET